MKLRYIYLNMADSVCSTIDRSDFNYHTYFIGYCLSKEVRKLKFETDGTFSGISIQVGSLSSSAKYFNDYLMVGIPFDTSRYDDVDEKSRCRYLIELARTGLIKAATIKEIPLIEILGLLTALEENGFIYSWKLKNISVPEYNLKLKFNCYLTTNDFTLRLSAYEKKLSSVKEMLCAQNHIGPTLKESKLNLMRNQ